MTLLKQELKMNLKSLLIWTLCVGICCSGCILMFESLEDSMAEMGQMFARLLATVQSAGLIDFNLNVLVEPQECLPETRMLLESLLDVKRRFQRRRKLLTHRDILKIWLRKNNRFKAEFLPGMF